MWDICVGGIVASGETYEAAAGREFAEELGVDDAVLRADRRRAIRRRDVR